MTTGPTKQKKIQVSSATKSKEEPKKKKSSVSSIFASKEDPKAKKSTPGSSSHHKEEPKVKKSAPAPTSHHKEESKAKKPTMSSMLKSKDTEPKRSIFTKDRTHPEKSHSTKDTSFKPTISKASGSLSDPEKSMTKHPKGVKKVKKVKA
ncbi:hypothetical protein CLU79DRAFT_349154 [Phycomyces nitens]|nr:hypothetical protein CLU79DRAFT_349154 [Phycomyces nitens]